MLIVFNRRINYGDLFITNQGGYFLVIRNIFSDNFPVSVIDLTNNKVDDELTCLEDVGRAYDIVEVISSNQLILSKEGSDLC